MLLDDQYDMAQFSPCKKYRYLLGRVIGTGTGVVTFIMLNPSTADAFKDDPTIRRCKGYARSWGYRILQVVNLFAWRTTNPKELYNCDDPIGADNDECIIKTCKGSDMVVAAWGAHGTFLNRDSRVLEMLLDVHVDVHKLKTTKMGHPAHPLYLKKDLMPKEN